MKTQNYYKTVFINNTKHTKMNYKGKKLIYIAGKLNDDAIGYLLNVSKLMANANRVRELGMGYFCPAIDLLMGIKFDYDDYHDYFDNGQIVLLHCDAMLVTPGWETSKGTKLEIALAERNDIPVFYSLDELRKWEKTEQTDIMMESLGGA